jgi:hypothetical protein
VLKLLAKWQSCDEQLRHNATRLLGSRVGRDGKPSGKDKATEPKAPPTAGGEPCQKGSKTSKLTIDEERSIELIHPPQGSRFQGYTDYVVQDLGIRPHVVEFPLRTMANGGRQGDDSALPAGLPARTASSMRPAMCCAPVSRSPMDHGRRYWRPPQGTVAPESEMSTLLGLALPSQRGEEP